MDFDIFLHDGGRATEWVRRASVGDVLAIAGPGGGGIPQVSRILLFADETAFPAAARILASLPADSQGQVTLVAAEGEASGYPIRTPKGVQLTWLSRRDASDLAERTLSARATQPDHFFWFASEKSDVTPVRQAIKAAPPAAGTSYIAAYWSKP
jgi:ferric-chelate reductase (NADPH)